MLLYISVQRTLFYRGVAQLGARGVWDHEGAGSIPVASTIFIAVFKNFGKFLKSLKCEKAHVSKIVACVFNFIKLYKIMKMPKKSQKYQSLINSTIFSIM